MSWNLPALLSGGFGAALVTGAVLIVRALIARPLVQATAADKLSASAVKLIEAAQKSADDANADALAQIREARDEARAARADADLARRDATEARREAVDARREAADVAREFRRITAAILSPYATIESLRAMVSEGPGNGVAHIPASS